MAGLFDKPSVSFVQVAVERGVDQFPDGLTYGVTAELDPISEMIPKTFPQARFSADPISLRALDLMSEWGDDVP